MKKILLISLITLSSILNINAQWTGTNPVWTNSNVGIGTTSPSSKLEVVGSGGITSFTGTAHLGLLVRGSNNAGTDHSGIDFTGYSADYFGNPLARIAVKPTGAGSYLLFGTSNSYVSGITNTAMVIDYNGNVGIGTSTPIDKLQVSNGFITAGTSSATSGTLQFAGYYHNDNILNTYGSQYSSGATSIGYAVKQKVGSKGLVSSAGNSSFKKGMLIIDNEMEFLSAPASNVAIDSDVTLTSRFIIKENGNVGIGTRTPNATLQIGDSDNSGSPSSEIEVKRLSLAPVTHSGSDWFFTTRDNNPYANLDIGYGNNKTLTLRHDGNVGIGTTETGTHKLAVDGTIGAREIKVEAGAWSDFVFNKDYDLKDLEEVENYIKVNNHLPDIPSEQEVKENGIQLGEMDAKLLQKIEELTLYMIEINKEVKSLKEENELLKSQVGIK